jgi:hypothetical protein
MNFRFPYRLASVGWHPESLRGECGSHCKHIDSVMARRVRWRWIPASAGKTEKGAGMTELGCVNDKE